MKKILENPTGVIFLTFILVLGGVFAGSTLSVSMFPLIEKPTVRVNIRFPGVSSKEIYDNYSKDFRKSLQKINNPTEIIADYESGRLSAAVTFDYQKNQEEAINEVTVAFDSFKNQLPKNVQSNMWIGTWDNGQGILIGGFASKKNKSPEELYQIVQPRVENKINQVKGVNRDNSGVGRTFEPEIVIEFDELKLAQFGLFLPNVIRTIYNEVQNISSGRIVKDTSTVYIRTVVNEKSLDDFKKIIVDIRSSESSLQPSHVVYLENIAKIYLNRKLPRRVWRVNGKPAVMTFTTAKSGGNLLEMSKGVKKVLHETSFPEDIFYRFFLDPSKYINESIINMIISALIGTLIATLVVYLFVGQFGSTFLIALSIPTSIIASFLLMKLFNININMISLGGMALAVGMIVDSSIVSLENIFRHIEGNSQANKLEVITGAIKEVRWPIIISTLTSIIVFLPLSYTSAMANAILGDMSRVVVFALLISIATAVLLLPVLCRWFISSKDKQSRTSEKWNQHVNAYGYKLYEKLLNKALKSKKRSILTSVLIFTLLGSISVLLVSGIRKEIIAEPEPSIFIVKVDANYVQDKAKLLELTKPFEEKLEKASFFKEIDTYISRARLGNRGTIFIIAKDDINTKEMKSQLEDFFENTPDLKFRVDFWNPSRLPLPMIWDIETWVMPNSQEFHKDALKLCDAIVDELGASIEVSAWCVPDMNQNEEILIKPNKKKLAHIASSMGKNVSSKDISDLIRIATHEKYLSEINFNGVRTPIYARFKEGTINSPEKIENLSIPFPDKNQKTPPSYSLKTFADVVTQKAEPSIREVDLTSSVRLMGYLKGKMKHKKDELKIAVQDAVKKAKENNPDLAAAARIDNPYEDIDRSINSLVTSLGISIILVITLLVLQFQSIKQALIITSAVPLGFFGVIVALFVFDSTLSLNSMLGLILLAGIAVNNSILLMDFYNKGRENGLPIKEAVLSAVQVRFRPIMMTMLTTILAMLPIALSIGSGGEPMQPLGIAVSGGLLASTVFTLLVVPLLIFIFERQESNESPA